MNLSLYLLLAEPAEAKKPIQLEKLPASEKREPASRPVYQPTCRPIFDGGLRIQVNGVSKAQAIRVGEKTRYFPARNANSLAFGLSVAGNAMAFIAMTAGVLLLLQIAQVSLI